MIYGISYINEISVPINERKQKGVNYISTSLQDIKRDSFLLERYNRASKEGSSDYKMDIYTSKNMLKYNELRITFSKLLGEIKSIKALIRQFTAINLEHMDSSDLIEIIDRVYNDSGLSSDILSEVISGVLVRLISFKKNLFKAEHKIVFYEGLLNLEGALLLHILSCMGYDIVYVNNFIEDSEFRYSWIRKPTVKYKVECKDVNISNTIAYNAQEEIRGILSNNLVRKENEKREDIKVSYLRCTLDEIGLYIHEPVKVRPNFIQDEGKLQIPTLVGIFQGVSTQFKDYNALLTNILNDDKVLLGSSDRDIDLDDYEDDLKKVLCKSGVDWDSKVARKSRINDIKEPMKTHVKGVIDRLVCKCDKRKDKMSFLSVVLYLHSQIIQMYNNFVFTERNPKYVVYTDELYKYNKYDIFLWQFLAETGWDVLIFSPDLVVDTADWAIPVYTLGAFRGLTEKEKYVKFKPNGLFSISNICCIDKYNHVCKVNSLSLFL